MKKFITIFVIALAFSLVALSACEPMGSKDISVQKPVSSSVTHDESEGGDNLSGSTDNSPNNSENAAISAISVSDTGDGSGTDDQSTSSAGGGLGPVQDEGGDTSGSWTKPVL